MAQWGSDEYIKAFSAWREKCRMPALSEAEAQKLFRFMRTFVRKQRPGPACIHWDTGFRLEEGGAVLKLYYDETDNGYEDFHDSTEAIMIKPVKQLFDGWTPFHKEYDVNKYYTVSNLLSLCEKTYVETKQIWRKNGSVTFSV